MGDGVAALDPGTGFFILKFMEKPNIILQLKDHLKNNYTVKNNIDTGWVEVNGKNLTNIQLNSVYLDCKVVFPKTTKHLVECILHSDFVETYNPRPKI